MLKDMRETAQENHIPILRDKSTEILDSLCKTNKPKRILEIGTAIGYSGIIMLRASENSELTTIEKNEERYKQALINFDKEGLSNRVNVILGDAEYELQKLALKSEKYNFIFLDGPKGQYIKYLPYLKNLLACNGVLFADNIYFRGLVKQEEKVAHKHRTIVNNLRKFIKTLQEDDDFVTEFLDIEDGMSISYLKNKQS